MSDAAAAIIAALIGFVGGLIVAAFTFRQKADELFLAGLQYLGGGSQERNLGIAALEDKIVQQAVVTVLNAIYEEDFIGFSYGFRPGRGAHQALRSSADGRGHAEPGAPGYGGREGV